MAYSDIATKSILEAIAPFDITIYDTVRAGDLLGLDATNDGMCLADEDEPVAAVAIAMEHGVSGDTIKACLAAVIRTSSACAASTDQGSPLYLSATAGHMSLSAGGTTVQVVGAVLSTDKIFVIPGNYLSSTSQTLSGALSVGTTLSVTGAVTHASTLAQQGVQTMATNVKLQFRDTGLYINSGADGKITISSDGTGTDDITLSGTVTLDDDLITPTTKKFQFRDSGIYINSGADGKITISADGTGSDDITLDGGVTFGDVLISDAQYTSTVSANKTLVLADCGITQLVNTDAKTITLPATSIGLTYKIVNIGADGAVLITIDPNASDKISGAGLTPADNKDLLNTKATAKRGDYVVLMADGVDGWVVADMAGTWAREG